MTTKSSSLSHLNCKCKCFWRRLKYVTKMLPYTNFNTSAKLRENICLCLRKIRIRNRQTKIKTSWWWRDTLFKNIFFGLSPSSEILTTTTSLNLALFLCSSAKTRREPYSVRSPDRSILKPWFKDETRWRPKIRNKFFRVEFQRASPLALIDMVFF
jgi:hypothetical protein